jgi:Fe2+ or Zn2+ uptake regulation protein
MTNDDRHRAADGRYQQEVSLDDVAAAVETAVERTGSQAVTTREVHEELDDTGSRRTVRRRLNDLAEAKRVNRLEFDPDVPFLLWEPLG